jgi:cell wall-associated NlpC family hydrolase
MPRPAALAALLAAAGLSAACASTGAVPRPFPGAGPTSTAAGDAPPSEPPRAVAASPAEPAAPADAPGPEARPSVRDVEPAPMPLLTTALGLRGTPYRNGGADPSGFDCSGFVLYVFAAHGYRLPRETQAQFTAGRPVDRGEVQPGDLVFFETVSRGPSHVGIALGGDEFVHAPSSRGVVRVERYTTSYWARRWVGARRVSDAVQVARAD